MKVRQRENKGGSVSWQVDLGMIEGRRVQKSFATKAEALAALADRKDQRRAHGTQSLALSEADRARFVEARDRLAAVGATIGEAVEYFVKHARPTGGELALEVLVERCVADKAAQGRNADYTRELRRNGLAFARTVGFEQAAHAVQPKEIEAWLRGNGWSPKSQLVYLTDLSTVFAWGVAKGHLAINPCATVSRPVLLPKAPAIFDVVTCRRLLTTAAEALDLEVLPYLAICLFAGVRPEECEALTWENVDLGEGHIEITAEVAKRVRGVRRRIVRIEPTLAAWLDLVPPQERRGPIPPPGLVKRRRKLCERAGVPEWPQDVLRHSFASYHLARFRNAEQTRLEMGHRDTELLFSTYREVVRPKDAEAFWGLLPPK